MAKKISEKELNNVSGGCGGNSLYYKLSCYDANNVQVGPVIETSHTSSPNTANREMVNKCNELFVNNNTITYINWVFYDGSHTNPKGTKYRNEFIK